MSLPGSIDSIISRRRTSVSFGPAMISGFVRFAPSMESSSMEGMPEQWSA